MLTFSLYVYKIKIIMISVWTLAFMTIILDQGNSLYQIAIDYYTFPIFIYTIMSQKSKESVIYKILKRSEKFSSKILLSF